MVDLSRQATLREAIELFYFAYRAFTAHPDAILADRGLGRVHHRILYFVGRTPGIVINDLLTTLQVSKQALNAPLRELINQGLVTSTPSENDRRFRHLHLTVDGEALEAELSGTQIALLAQVFGQVGPEAETRWKHIMEMLPTALSMNR